VICGVFLLQSAGKWCRAGEASASEERDEGQNEPKCLGCCSRESNAPCGVKYKAQDVVLAARIPLFTRHSCFKTAKIGSFAVDFSELAHGWRGLLFSNKALFEGRLGGREGQGAEVVQIVWIGVEKEEKRDGTLRRCRALRCLDFDSSHECDLLYS
jgi:hypothetical protein